MADTTTCNKLSVHAMRSCRSPIDQSLLCRYNSIRATTETLCAPLETEDYVVQSMPNASPVRWHLAHATWLFEAMVLKPGLPKYEPMDHAFNYLFNSYYNSIGKQHPRPKRGLITRPTVKQVYEYRHYVDLHMRRLIESLAQDDPQNLAHVVDTGLHHEQQHQELMLTDLKHLFSRNPLYPAYRDKKRYALATTRELGWSEFSEQLRYHGNKGDGFCYDNEQPRHRVFVEAFALADRLVTNAEYLEFINDGGYEQPAYWLSDGWRTVQTRQWQSPLYWIKQDNDWLQYTLHGLGPIVSAQPVCHVSYYEADAFARWAHVRLPTEAEWETVSCKMPVIGNFLENQLFHPAPAPPMTSSEPVGQLFGDVWEWTASAYNAYPGYQPPSGPLGEYNGKFMCNQFVLRGGSCVSPRSHIRPTYRNFLPPEARWQFTGIRLAK